MPPAHGPAIVEAILAAEGLTRDWLSELDSMRGRLDRLRRRFADGLAAATGINAFTHLANRRGMFLSIPLKEGASAELSAAHGIYLPQSGRINVAGLHEDTVESAAERLAPFVEARG